MGIETPSLPGRFEVVPGQPTYVLMWPYPESIANCWQLSRAIFLTSAWRWWRVFGR